MNIFVTGASGFIGRALCCALEKTSAYSLIRSSRKLHRAPQNHVAAELGAETDWKQSLIGIDVVVHLAGKAHDLRSSDQQSIYHQINAAGTGRLASEAADAGVKHVIFLSSCHAVATESDEKLTEATVPRPTSIYGQSKLEAEKLLVQNLSPTPTAWTILRPPLVYGPENLANFQRLVSLVRSGAPLPLKSVNNQRSFIGVDNLVDVIIRCIENPNARRRMYYPSDGTPVSTPELIEAIAHSLGRHARLFPFPQSVLSLLAQRVTPLRKLMSSLFVDSSPLRDELGWEPLHTLAAGLSQLRSRPSQSSSISP